jgi:hypothetical protein
MASDGTRLAWPGLAYLKTHLASNGASKRAAIYCALSGYGEGVGEQASEVDMVVTL